MSLKPAKEYLPKMALDLFDRVTDPTPTAIREARRICDALEIEYPEWARDERKAA